jgi:hypothetical protein
VASEKGCAIVVECGISRGGRNHNVQVVVSKRDVDIVQVEQPGSSMIPLLEAGPNLGKLVGFYRGCLVH